MSLRLTLDSPSSRPSQRRVAEMAAPEGHQRVTRCGFRFGDGNPAPSSPAPALSAQTEAWLERLGYGEDDIRRLKNAKVI